MNIKLIKLFVISAVIAFNLMSSRTLFAQQMWTEVHDPAYFREVLPCPTEYPGFNRFFAAMVDINSDGLADLVWLSRQDPINHGGTFDYVTSWPAFSINRGTFENPEWPASHRAWGYMEGDEPGEKVGEITIPSIYDYNGDGFGDLLVLNRDEQNYAPVWYLQSSPDYVENIPTLGSCHNYFEYFTGHPSGLRLPTFPNNPWCGGLNENYCYFLRSCMGHNFSGDFVDLDKDGDMDIVVGINVDYNIYSQCYPLVDPPSPYGDGRVLFWMNNTDYPPSGWSLEASNNPYLWFINHQNVSGYYRTGENNEPENLDWYDLNNGTVNPMPESYLQRANPAVGDIDMDGVYELIVSDVRGNLFCFKMVDNDPLKWANKTDEFLTTQGVTIANDEIFPGVGMGGNSRPSFFDYDYDGDLDLLVSDYSSNYVPGMADLHLYINNTAKRLVEVTCIEGCNQTAHQGETVTFKWQVKNIANNPVFVRARMVAYYRDNHPYPYNPLWSREGTMPIGSTQTREISYQIPSSTFEQSYGEQRFYFEVTHAGNTVTGEYCKARTRAIVNVIQ